MYLIFLWSKESRSGTNWIPNIIQSKQSDNGTGRGLVFLTDFGHKVLCINKTDNVLNSDYDKLNMTGISNWFSLVKNYKCDLNEELTVFVYWDTCGLIIINISSIPSLYNGPRDNNFNVSNANITSCLLQFRTFSWICGTVQPLYRTDSWVWAIQFRSVGIPASTMLYGYVRTRRISPGRVEWRKHELPHEQFFGRGR